MPTILLFNNPRIRLMKILNMIKFIRVNMNVLINQINSLEKARKNVIVLLTPVYNSNNRRVGYGLYSTKCDPCVSLDVDLKYFFEKGDIPKPKDYLSVLEKIKNFITKFRL